MNISLNNLKKIRKVFVLISLFFILVAIVFLIFIIVCLFLNDNNDFVRKNDIYYFVASISATISFGLCTVQFTLRNVINERNSIIKEKQFKTNDALERFLSIVSTKDYLFVSSVLIDIENIYHLEDFDNHFFEDGMNEDEKVREVANRILQQSSGFFSNLRMVILNNLTKSTTDPNILGWNLNTNPDLIYNYFEQKLIYITNYLESICYLYLNDVIDTCVFDSETNDIIEKFYVRSSIIRSAQLITGDLPFTFLALCKKHAIILENK